MQGDVFVNRRTDDACKDNFFLTDEHVKHARVQAKEQRAHAASSEPPRPSKALHTLTCGGEAMTHHEDIHHLVVM